MIMPYGGMPQVDASTLKAWSTLSYPGLCTAFLRLFIPAADVTDSELSAIVSEALASFGDAEVVKLQTVDGPANRDGCTTHVLELWHGPTLAFKDLGMQILVKFLKWFLARRKEAITLLVGTSGDTGSSAIEAVRGLPNVDIVFLFPCCGRISAVQERQMTSVSELEPNVWCVGVEGTSDDLDVPMEEVFGDGVRS